MVPAEEALRSEVRALVDRWIAATLARDAQAYADLYLREPDPVVAWASGEVSRGWKRVHEHAQREFYTQKTVIRSVDVYDLDAVALGESTVMAVFAYDVHAHDLWGATLRVKRMASATLLRTKDGLRIASAHFAPAR